jgi:RNA polymerase sigma-70 factor (ECF subfamily)
LHEERELIRSMLSGDERAFGVFFEHYFPRLYRFALPRLGGDVEASREVVQATLVKAMRNLEHYKGNAALFTWMCQICRHEVVDHLRAVRRLSRHVVLYEDRPEVRAAVESFEAPPEFDPAQCHGRAEVAQLVRSVLDRLPAKYGEVLEWKYIEGLSVDEIGVKMGLGHGAAQSLLARARDAFRKAVETIFGAAAADVVSAME